MQQEAIDLKVKVDVFYKAFFLVLLEVDLEDIQDAQYNNLIDMLQIIEKKIKDTI